MNDVQQQQQNIPDIPFANEEPGINQTEVAPISQPATVTNPGVVPASPPISPVPETNLDQNPENVNPVETQSDLPFKNDENIPQVETPVDQGATVIAPQQTNSPAPVSQPVTQPQMPTEVDAYKPLEVQAQIAEISPGKFDNLTKVLDILRQGKPTAITIKDSFIHENVSGATLVADVNSVFDTAVNFQITDPKKHIDLFKQFKGNNNVFILDDPENVRYIVTNGPIKIFLPKQIDQLVAETSAPDINGANTICTKMISKEVRDEIRGIGKHSTSIEFLIQANQIKAMHIPNTGIYRFSEFIKDPTVAKLDETNADLVLKSEIFLPVDSDNFNVNIVQKPDTGDYISVTECNAGMIKMWIYEQLENTTGGTIKF